MDGPPLAALASGLKDATIAKEYAVASWALFLYEYAITFDQEVSNVWRPRGSYLLKFLWVFNRYTFFASFTPTLLLSVIAISPELYRCQTFVKFPAAMQVLLNASAGGTLVLRTYALYACQKWILYTLLPIVVIDAAVETWAVTMGVPAKLPPGIAGCILTGNPDDGDRFAAYWVGQLVFPTLVFGMTIGRVIFLRREGLSKGGIMEVLLRDGVIYFAVIFLTNLVNVITFATASQTIQQINAPFTEMITAVMICRLILNLRSERPSVNDEVKDVSRLRCASPNRAGVRGKMESTSFCDSDTIGSIEWDVGRDSVCGSESAGASMNEKGAERFATV